MTAAEAAGHRSLPHTADCIVEAWGPDRPSCLAEALTGLVESFAEVAGDPATTRRPLSAPPGDDADVLVDLLQGVICTVDIEAVVPVRFHLRETEGGGITGDMEVVPAAVAELVGPLPKAVSYHDLAMTATEGGWRCRALIDV